MYKFEVVEAKQFHIDELKEIKLRDDDIKELWDAYHIKAEDALQISFDMSLKSWAGLLNGKTIFVFGVSPRRSNILSDEGEPWLLASKDIEKVKMSFLKKSRYYVGEMLKLFNKLINFVDTRNTVSKKWLEWCGFKIEDPKAYGLEGKLFHRFTMEVS